MTVTFGCNFNSFNLVRGREYMVMGWFFVNAGSVVVFPIVFTITVVGISPTYLIKNVLLETAPLKYKPHLIT